MRKMSYVPQLVVFGLLLLMVLLIYVFSTVFSTLSDLFKNSGNVSTKNSWIYRLLLNLIGYATILFPGYLMYKYVKNSTFLDRADPTCFTYLIKKLFYGSEKKGYSILEGNKLLHDDTFFFNAIKLFFSGIGMIVAYVAWGLLQEKIITQNYVNAKGETKKFGDSQFLVFVNRVLAFLLSACLLLLLNQPKQTVPFYKFVFCSFSNIMSSWCQYEALKFISFPTQVLAKASKIIPVMLMGKVVFGKKYDHYEYVTSVFICVGMGLFLIGSQDTTTNSEVSTTVSGIVLIVSYMAFDSFTSNWQSELFTKYTVTSLQMMCGVNFFSCLLTTVTLVQQKGLEESFLFMFEFPTFAFDCALLSICSAVGQLFIFYIISVFGPVVYVITMTLRQILAIILSCITYHHQVTIIGVLGIIVVFAAIFLRIYCGQRLKMLRQRNLLSV